MQNTKSDEARELLDEKFRSFKPISKFTPPSKGWVRTIRRAIGMNSRQLAIRLGQSQPRVADIEKREIDSAVTLRTLKRVAQALDCHFVYALVPNETLEKMVRQQATKIASRRLRTVTHTMALENQAVSKSTSERQRTRLIESIIETELNRIWNEEQ